MEPKKKWALAAVAAAGALGVGAVALGLKSRYMLMLAMDRALPPGARRKLDRVRGNAAAPELRQKLERGKRWLEEAGAETVTLTSHDGLTLVGHWLEAREPRRVIVAFHGWRGSWSRDFGLAAEDLRDRGCSVLYPEQRGQGRSGGAYMGFGLLERHDCLRWARWAARRCPGLPVYLMGVSMGATTVLVAGGMELPESVRGILADCGFTSPGAIWKHVAQENLRLRYGLYAGPAQRLCRRKIRLSPGEYSTTDALQECRLPVLLIHGTADSFVPVSMTYENYLACAGPRELLVVPGAEHGMSYLTEPDRYRRTLEAFWRRWDGQRGSAEEAGS